MRLEPRRARLTGQGAAVMAASRVMPTNSYGIMLVDSTRSRAAARSRRPVARRSPMHPPITRAAATRRSEGSRRRPSPVRARAPRRRRLRRGRVRRHACGARTLRPAHKTSRPTVCTSARPASGSNDLLGPSNANLVSKSTARTLQGLGPHRANSSPTAPASGSTGLPAALSAPCQPLHLRTMASTL
jgi:hypothetical protein